MTPAEAVQRLDGLDASNPEEAHILADEVLFILAPAEVREAYDRVAERAGAWWYA